MHSSMIRSQTTGAAPSAPARPVVAAPVPSRTQKSVRCAAKGNSDGALNQVAIKVFGALAAAQLAVSGPALAFDLIPETVKSQSARDELNRRTSNLPSLGEVGRDLNKEFGESSPEQVGDEIAKNTPDVDLTQNPKQLGEEAGDAIKDAGKEVAKAAPVNLVTLLDLPSPQELVGKITGTANDAAGQAKGAASDAAGSAKGAASEAKGKAKSVANSTSLNFITMLDLPSPQDVASKAKGAVESAKSGAQQAGNKAQGSLQSGSGDVKKVATQGNLNFISLLDLPSPQELIGKITGSANDAAGQAKGAASDTAGSAKGAANEASGAVKGAVKKAPVSTLTFALANPAGNAQDILGKAKTSASDALAKATESAKKSSGKKSGVEKAASSAKAQVKGAAA